MRTDDSTLKGLKYFSPETVDQFLYAFASPREKSSRKQKMGPHTALRDVGDGESKEDGGAVGVEGRGPGGTLRPRRAWTGFFWRPGWGPTLKRSLVLDLRDGPRGKGGITPPPPLQSRVYGRGLEDGPPGWGRQPHLPLPP